MDPKPGDRCPYRKAQEEGGGPHADAGRTCLSRRVPGLTGGHRRLGKGLGPGAPWGPPIGQIWDLWPHDWERMGFCGWTSPARGRAFGHPGHSHRGAGARASVRLRVPSEGSIHRRGLPSLFPQWVAVATWGLGTGGQVGDGASPVSCLVETPTGRLESAHEPSAPGSPTAPVTRLHPAPPADSPAGRAGVLPRGSSSALEAPSIA